jgi:hypothetical protein
VKVSQQTDAQKFKSVIIKDEGTDNNQMQNKLVKEHYHRVQQILKIQLKEHNHSYQYLSLSVLVYSFRSQLGEIRNWEDG